jgi:hypothetical protein
MKLENLLINLLFRHDCVIIPGFGGLLTRDYPAHINHATHMFMPPSRRVSFNSRLVQNDGVLTHAFAQKLAIPYSDALQRIEQIAQSWLHKIKEGEQLQLEDIGRFYINQEGSLQFKPVVDANFSQDAFGLGVFRISPVVDRNILQHMNQQPEVAVKVLHRSRRRTWIRAAAILIPVAGLLYLGATKNDFSEQALRNTAGFFFPNSSTNVEAPIEVVPGMDAAAYELEAKATATEDAVQIEEAEQVFQAPSEEVSSSQVDFTEPNFADEVRLTEFPFQVVVGSFSTEQNARKLVKNLSGAFVLPGTGKLVKVSAGGFATREEANAFLQTNREELPRGAWVFRQ